ncbi:MAG: DNA polymerase III subunit delta [candidate division Zixibacteria bacterium]|nr:DNA polymerase III subunit delta [candidate division Zixibacteria bacterium]
MLKPSQLARDINAGKFKPAYYLFGVEDFRIVEAEKYIVSNFLPDRQLTTNYRKINGRRISCANLIAELSNLPMLGERQVFSIAEFQSFKPTEVDRILKLLSPPDANRIVIFSSPSARMPKKKSAFIKKVAKATEIVEFSRLSAKQVGERFRSGLKQYNIKISNEALNLLIELIGGNSGGVTAELAKLRDFKNPGETVTADDIQKITTGYEVYNIFELAEKVVEGNTRTTLKMLDMLVKKGNSPVTICSLLTRHFLFLYIAKNGHQLPLTPNQRFLIPRFRKQANLYDNMQLEQTLIDLATCDADLRVSRMKPKMVLEVLLLRLLGERQTR